MQDNRQKSARERASSFAKYLGKGHSIQKNGDDNYGVYLEDYGLVASIHKNQSSDQLFTIHTRKAHNEWHG